MALFGLVTKSEYAKLQQEIATLKAEFKPFERWQLETARAEMFNLPDPSVYEHQAELFRRLSWVVQAVDITAAAGALTPFSVARLVSGKEPKDIPNHPFEMLLQHPNPLDSRFEFLYATIALWMLNGNAYWWLNRSSKDAPPDEMWFIPPSMINPVPDGNMFLKGYLYYPGTGAEIFLEPHEIVHFKRFNPFSRFVGLSAIESIALVAGGDLAMQAWNTRLFGENNARLPGILSFEQMIADPTWQDIKDNTREAAKNRELLMLRGVGQGGVNWIQNAVSQKEMEFLAGREFNKQEIQNTLAPGLSTWLSENSTLANSTSNRAAFNELTLYPKHVMMAEKITSSILSSYSGRELIGRFEDIRISDKQMELEEQARYAETHTIAEIREEYYGDAPLGDERDDLLPVQIKAESGGIQDPPPPPIAPQLDKPMMDEKQQPDAMGKPQDENKETEAESTKRAMFEALSKYERYALRKIGKPLEFTNDILPDSMIREIAGAVKTCKDETDVRTVFTKYKAGYAGKIEPVNDAAMVLEGIRLALAKL